MTSFYIINRALLILNLAPLYVQLYLQMNQKPKGLVVVEEVEEVVGGKSFMEALSVVSHQSLLSNSLAPKYASIYIFKRG